MKKVISVLMLLLLLLLAGCGQQAAPAQTMSGESTQLANPWREVTEAEAKALYPQSFTLPDGAENAAWRVMESGGAPALLELDFELDGLRFTARQQQTGNRDADISGMFYTWTAQIGMTLRSGHTGTMYRWIGEDGYADLCVWYDEASGVSYSLSVTAKDLDGFDLQAVAEALFPQAEAVRRDGERFEAVIILEGMEETVPYEHIRNEALGFEMDYDYETFVRRSEPYRERIISVWDNAEKPENYLELTYHAENSETAAVSVRAELSQEYDLLESTRELDRAGTCLYMEASALKGTNTMADRLQLVYIIPASEGCIVATEHLVIEASEGFGRRFSYMLNTLEVIDRNSERALSYEQALSAIKKYCCTNNPDLERIVNAGEYQVYWEVVSSTDSETVVLFHSYTGAIIRYYIDPVSGETYVTEFVPGITPEEQRTGESFNIWEYLD